MARTSSSGFEHFGRKKWKNGEEEEKGRRRRRRLLLLLRYTYRCAPPLPTYLGLQLPTPPSSSV